MQSATERSYCFSPELLRPFLVGELADSNDQLWKAPGTAMVVVWRTTGLQMMAAILLNPRCWRPLPEVRLLRHKANCRTCSGSQLDLATHQCLITLECRELSHKVNTCNMFRMPTDIALKCKVLNALWHYLRAQLHAPLNWMTTGTTKSANAKAIRYWMPSGTTFSSAVKGIECPLALPLAQLTSTCTIVLNAHWHYHEY